LIDCGYNERTGLHPVEGVVAEHGPIGGLVIQNYDEDHVDDLPRLFARLGPRTSENEVLKGQARPESRVATFEESVTQIQDRIKAA
jgi:hypothetical protein